MDINSNTRRRAALTVTALTGLGLIAAGLSTAAPASARTAASEPVIAATCSVTGIKPATVIVGLSKVSPTWSVSTSGCVVESWEITLPHGLGSATSANPVRTINPAKLKNAWAGANTAKVTVTETTEPPEETAPATTEPTTQTPETPETPEPSATESAPTTVAAADATGNATFTLKRRSAWTGVKISPQPVDGGRQLTLKGTLKLADWTDQQYANYTGRKIQLQFRGAGKTAWKNVKTVRTTSKGRIGTSVKATADGAWRLHFAGTSVVGAANSTADYVEVITARDRKKFANCDAMHEVYPHGVGKVGAVDSTSGDPVTDFTRNNHLYTVNTGSDRDKDKIACEA